MRVVSDTSPISNLAMIGRLDFLRRLHGTILISPVVAAELSRLRHPVGLAAIEAALADGWLKIEPLAIPAPDISGLHAGETESIALALSEPGATLLMDEADGRKAARARGVTLGGVVGVLIAARKKDWIPALKPELLALRLQARFFLSPRFFAEALAVVGETP